MSESKPVWGSEEWAIEIVKQLKPSLQRLVGDYTNSDMEFLGQGVYSMVVRVQDYAVKLFIPEVDRKKADFDKNCRDGVEAVLM